MRWGVKGAASSVCLMIPPIVNMSTHRDKSGKYALKVEDHSFVC